MHWDLFCRVVDNHGDLGVCWRLAADLATRGEHVRLWVDDAAALDWMAPGGAARVEVRGFFDAAVEPADVVMEAFGCDPPAAFVARMQRPRPPLWINLEYLSAEPYVLRSHGLPSPQQLGPGAGLCKWFYYPGFTRGTGGLMREPGLMQAQAAFEREPWFAAHGLLPSRGERVVSLFCYRNAALTLLLDALAAKPTLLLAAAGSAAEQVQAALGPSLRKGQLRAVPLPYLAQSEFDRLLWACELNFVRGEDSCVRAQWAGAPFVWQAYVQQGGAHRVKVDAFLHLFLEDAPVSIARTVHALFEAWNGWSAWPTRWPDASQWQAHARAWRARQLVHPDLVTRLIEFALDKRR